MGIYVPHFVLKSLDLMGWQSTHVSSGSELKYRKETTPSDDTSPSSDCMLGTADGAACQSAAEESDAARERLSV